MTTHLELDRETEKLKEPSKRWRNKWRMVGNSYVGSLCGTCGKMAFRATGDVFDTCCKTWPSREIAEAKAHEGISESLAKGRVPLEWLGAFPVDAA